MTIQNKVLNSNQQFSQLSIIVMIIYQCLLSQIVESDAANHKENMVFMQLGPFQQLIMCGS